METLKQFIKNTNLEKKVICIVPISNENFDKEKTSYLKSLDYIHQFKPKGIEFHQFIEAIFNSEYFDGSNWIEHLNFLFKRLLQDKDITIRELKTILRNTNIKFNALSEQKQDCIDIRVMLIFASLHHLKDNFVNFINNSRYQLTNHDSWTKNSLILIANDIKEIGGYKTNIPFVFVDNPKLKIPNLADDFVNGGEGNKYFLSDIYLNLYLF